MEEHCHSEDEKTHEHTLSFNTHRDLKRFESAQMSSHVSLFFYGILQNRFTFIPLLLLKRIDHENRMMEPYLED